MKSALRIAFATAALTLAPAADTNTHNPPNTPKFNTPFLIERQELPHMTKTIMERWDDEKLALTDNQKEQLLKVRNRTIGKIAKLKKEIYALENLVVKAMELGRDPDGMALEISEISKLKAEVTKIHLKCIFDTSKILTDEQKAYLFPEWARSNVKKNKTG